MCPQCREPMIACELEGVEIDQCLDCRGIWLDAGELEMLTELAGVDPGGMTAALGAAAHIRRTQRRCPRCNRKMQLISVGRPAPVELDRCPVGHGLWFDHGELQAVIANFHEGEEGTVATFFADLLGHDSQPKTEGGV